MSIQKREYAGESFNQNLNRRLILDNILHDNIATLYYKVARDDDTNPSLDPRHEFGDIDLVLSSSLRTHVSRTILSASTMHTTTNESRFFTSRSEPDRSYTPPMRDPGTDRLPHKIKP